MLYQVYKYILFLFMNLPRPVQNIFLKDWGIYDRDQLIFLLYYPKVEVQNDIYQTNFDIFNFL